VRLVAVILTFWIGFVVSSGSRAQDILSQSHEEDLRVDGLDWLLPLAECAPDVYAEQSQVSDVDEDLCEADLAKCVEECRNNNAKLCFSAAYEYERRKNYAHAHALFQRSCEFGITTACTNLASHQRAHGESSDACIANAFFEACERNDEWGCVMSSIVVWQEEGVEPDPAKARRYAEKVCSLDSDHEACSLAERVLADINRNSK
jgi:hypothetical protein